MYNIKNRSRWPWER